MVGAIVFTVSENGAFLLVPEHLFSIPFYTPSIEKIRVLGSPATLQHSKTSSNCNRA